MSGSGRSEDKKAPKRSKNNNNGCLGSKRVTKRRLTGKCNVERERPRRKPRAEVTDFHEKKTGGLQNKTTGGIREQRREELEDDVYQRGKD